VQRALAIWQGHAGFAQRIGVCLNNLGRICEERGQTEQGIALHRQALALRQRSLGEHEDTAFSLGNLGVALAAAGYWAEAAARLREAVALYGKLGRGDSAEAQSYRSNLAICEQTIS